MRYLVTARVKGGRNAALRRAIDEERLGRGSVAGDEYLRDMQAARTMEDGRVCWVETCFCATPLQEERPYWEEYFHLTKVRDAHDRRRCRERGSVRPFHRPVQRVESPKAAVAAEVLVDERGKAITMDSPQ